VEANVGATLGLGFSCARRASARCVHCLNANNGAKRPEGPMRASSMRPTKRAANQLRPAA
jgi:hypothetical protein